MSIEIKLLWAYAAMVGFVSRHERSSTVLLLTLIGALMAAASLFAIHPASSYGIWFTAKMSALSFVGGYGIRVVLSAVFQPNQPEVRPSPRLPRTPAPQQVSSPTDNDPLNPATPERRTASRPSGVPTLSATHLEPLPHGAVQAGILRVVEAGHPCPLCRCKVEEWQPYWTCRKCLVKHHRDCWEWNAFRCTTFACDTRKREPEPIRFE